jgi:hypothetical protein
MEKLIDLNPVLKKIAMKLVDPSIGEIKPKRGEIREVKKDELDQVVNLLNTHSEVLDIGSLWTREFLQKMIDWRYKIYVWVDNDNEEVLGAVITYEEVADLGKEDFICGFLKEMVFKNTIDDDEKKIFIYNILNRFKDKKIPNVSYPCPKDGMNIIKKVGFQVLPVDKRTAYIKPLNNKIKEIIENTPRFKVVNVFLIC